MSFRIQSFEQYQHAYEQSVNAPEAFWADVASHFSWRKKWDKVLSWNFTGPEVRWFEGARLNITENCLDRHLAERGDQPALIWEANDPSEASRTFTYTELHAEVCRFAAVLVEQGARKGDRICIYLPMVPELLIAVLACARIGAVHSVVFAGFAAGSLADRINDCGCKMVLTSDGAYRGAKEIPIKAVVDEALKSCPTVQHTIVLKRTGVNVDMQAGRDLWWHDALCSMQEAKVDFPAVEMDAEDLLFILYTSGSTGKPKGVVHTCGGYMVYTGYTFANVFQYKNEPGSKADVYWCTADIGWITGHSYLTYGPLLNGATTLMFEGIPTFPDAGRFWQVVEKHKVNIFYTAPTAIRSLEAMGTSFVEPYDLSSLRVLGSVGEPINEEAWHWYHQHIGKGKCPIVDTWWQTETGGIMISSLAGVTPEKPGYATLPLPGVQPVLMDEQGREVSGNGVEGRLCIRFPWPSMIRTTYGDHTRCRDTYFQTFPSYYFTGDGCKRDEQGYYRITGRVDDVIKVSGHLLGTAEIESAINHHPDIVESAVVGFAHDIKGWGIYAFVITGSGRASSPEFNKEIFETVNRIMGPIARPDKIQVVKGLPKTRSGKIMRRILRKIAEGDTSNLGDTTTLLDPAVVDDIVAGSKTL